MYISVWDGRAYMLILGILTVKRDTWGHLGESQSCFERYSSSHLAACHYWINSRDRSEHHKHGRAPLLLLKNGFPSLPPWASTWIFGHTGQWSSVTMNNGIRAYLLSHLILSTCMSTIIILLRIPTNDSLVRSYFTISHLCTHYLNFARSY